MQLLWCSLEYRYQSALLSIVYSGPFPPWWSILLSSCPFDDSHVNRCEVAFHLTLIWISLTISGHLFMWLYAFFRKIPTWDISLTSYIKVPTPSLAQVGLSGELSLGYDHLGLLSTSFYHADFLRSLNLKCSQLNIPNLEKTIWG